MYEDDMIEDRYLLNFTDLEKRRFRREHNEKLNLMRRGEAVPHSLLDIRYTLNRIYFDDPRVTSFALGARDNLNIGDVIAIRMVVAFDENSNCQDVRLENVGLTDFGAGLILKTLKKKSLKTLSLRGNDKLTDITFDQLDQLLSKADNRWEKVYLDDGRMSPKMRQRLLSHPNVVLGAEPKHIRIARQTPVRPISAEQHTL